MSARSMRRERARTTTRAQRRARRLRRRAAATAGAALATAAVLTPGAEAATFTVTSLADTDETEGTLREEIEDANQAVGDDVIVFQAELSGTITLISPPLSINTGGLDIQGPGASAITIDADSDTERVFDVQNFANPDTPVRIAGVRLTGGSPGNSGGAIMSVAGGGSPAELTLDSAEITGNETGDQGGGVFVDGGSLTVMGSTISGNESYDFGGGVKVEDTDGDQPYEVVIRDSVLTGNRAEDGGAVYATGFEGGMVVERSSITGNVAADDAGAMFIDSPDTGVAETPVTIDGTTIASNVSTEYGAINMQFPDGPFTVRDSTISGNSSEVAAGGLTVLSSPGDGAARVLNSTVTGNAGAVGGGIYNPDPNEIFVSSSVVAGNSATTSGSDLGDDGTSGGFRVGFSLIGSTAGAAITETPAGSNLLGVDPLLGPLADNGGPTQTHLPALTSPVLDAGIANGLDTDQRGLARTADLSAATNAAGGDGTDIGALEIQAAACKGANAPAFTGTEGDDSLTGTAGQDAIAGLAGNDGLAALEGDDCVSGDDGDDTADGGAGNDEVDGGAGNDAVTGAAGKDLLTAGAGADRAAGNGGKDKLKGEAGKDKLKGGGGKDKLAGAGGKDRLSGGGGKDKLKGGPGKDRIKTGGGRDKVNCGGGKDRVAAGPDDRIAANCERVL